MTLRHLIAAIAVVTLLAGCGSGPVRRITPSQVSIQELSAQPGGQWKLTLRIQNYSTVPMTYSSIHGTLVVAGADVGTIDVRTDFDIPANSADVVDTVVPASAALPSGDIAYKIEGTIATREPKDEFKFNRSSRLSPTPGLPNTWR
jgi:uncharacterized lipoprotein YmbA